MDSDYMPIREASAKTGYSVEYIRQLARRNQIKTKKLSQTFNLVCLSDLQSHRAAMTKERTTTPTLTN